MVRLVIRNIAFIIMSLSLASCSVLDNGYTNKHGQYVPKKPRFKLKDKPGIFPIILDTSNIYKMVEMYNNGILIYPKSDFSQEERYSFVYEINKIFTYIKFYENGRCLQFSIPVQNALGMPNELNEIDLNPNNHYSNKDYYYSPNGVDILIEGFAYGDGMGHYVISNYTLDNSGDSLIMQDRYMKYVYKKDTVPQSWNRYKIDW